MQGKPESKGSKIFRGSVKLMTKVVKMAASESGMLSEDELAAVEAAADAVHNQADADPNTSWKDRVKIGGEREENRVERDMFFVWMCNS